MRTDGKLPEDVARGMYEWRRMFSGPLARAKLEELEVSGSESYLVIETLTNRPFGVFRDGELDADPSAIPSSETMCTLFRAAKA